MVLWFQVIYYKKIREVFFVDKIPKAPCRHRARSCGRSWGSSYSSSYKNKPNLQFHSRIWTICTSKLHDSTLHIWLKQFCVSSLFILFICWYLGNGAKRLIVVAKYISSERGGPDRINWDLGRVRVILMACLLFLLVLVYLPCNVHYYKLIEICDGFVDDQGGLYCSFACSKQIDGETETLPFTNLLPSWTRYVTLT